MPLHQQLQERLASNCRITRRDAEGGLPPSMPWLQELAPAVAASGGLTVGGLRAALSSADGPVQRVAEKVRVREGYGRGTGPGTAAHWEAQPPVVAQGAAAALRTRPLPQPTASSLVVASFFFR
jgi:hypothetical protein